MSVSTKSVGFLVLAAISSACSSFHFDSQEVSLRRDAEQDVLEIELTYRNLWCGDDEDQIRKCEETVERITSGDRYFLLPPTFWDSDLDQAERELAEKEEGLSAYERRVLEFLRGITVLEARKIENDEGRLSLRQHFQIARISEGVRLLNESFHRAVLDEEDVEGGFAAASQPSFDAETCRLFVEEAKAGVEWVSWSGEVLRLQLPATPATAAHMLGDFLSLAAAEKSWNAFAVVAGMARSLSAIEVRDDHVYMEFRPAEDGWLRIDFSELEWEE